MRKIYAVLGKRWRGIFFPNIHSHGARGEVRLRRDYSSLQTAPRRFPRGGKIRNRAATAGRMHRKISAFFSSPNPFPLARLLPILTTAPLRGREKKS